jgi:hypothetical protein
LDSSSDAPPIPWWENPATFILQEEELQRCQEWPHPIHVWLLLFTILLVVVPMTLPGSLDSVSEVHQSVWRVVNAVNHKENTVMHFKYPADWAAQPRIAAGFERKSKAGFAVCAGAIDGILIWIDRPTLEDCEIAKCGPKKFFCGRKKKFGLNMQATCDAEGRFLAVSIEHPAAMSDYLAFCTSSFRHKLERPGFLAPKLCLFGNNAYVNTFYMATPFKSVLSGTKNNYNFYHSQVRPSWHGTTSFHWFVLTKTFLQLRINIECAFGMFVHCWGFLRKATPPWNWIGEDNCISHVSLSPSQLLHQQ